MADNLLSPETQALLDEASAVRSRRDIDAELCSAIVERNPDGIIVIDITGSIVLVNPAAETMFGYPLALMIGQPIEMLMPAASRVSHIGLRDLYMRDPRLRPMGVDREVLGKHRGGAEFPVNIMLSPLSISTGLYYMALLELPPR